MYSRKKFEDLEQNSLCKIQVIWGVKNNLIDNITSSMDKKVFFKLDILNKKEFHY